MPSRVMIEVPVASPSVPTTATETAPASDMAWIRQELLTDGRPSFAANNDHNDNDDSNYDHHNNDNDNDSTLSSTNLESALADLRQIAESRRSQVAQAVASSSSSASCTIARRTHHNPYSSDDSDEDEDNGGKDTASNPENVGQGNENVQDKPTALDAKKSASIVNCYVNESNNDGDAKRDENNSDIDDESKTMDESQILKILLQKQQQAAGAETQVVDQKENHEPGCNEFLAVDDVQGAQGQQIALATDENSSKQQSPQNARMTMEAENDSVILSAQVAASPSLQRLQPMDQASILLSPPALEATNLTRISISKSASKTPRQPSSGLLSGYSPGLSPIVRNPTQFSQRKVVVEKGPNQLHYEARWGHLRDKIQQHQQRSSNSRPMYRNMTLEQQERAQTKVVQLLHRLGIAKTATSTDNDDEPTIQNPVHHLDDSFLPPAPEVNDYSMNESTMSTLDASGLPNALPAASESNRNVAGESNESIESMADGAARNLTPAKLSQHLTFEESSIPFRSNHHKDQRTKPAKQLEPETQLPPDDSVNDDGGDDGPGGDLSSSVDSIEIARSIQRPCQTPLNERNTAFQSPNLVHGDKERNQAKRMATSSGKRGHDVFRRRRDLESEESERLTGVYDTPFSPRAPTSPRDSNGLGADDDDFDLNHGDSDGILAVPDISLGDSFESDCSIPNQQNNDTAERNAAGVPLSDSIHDSIMSYAHRNDLSRRPVLGEMVTNIGLKNGSTFHLKPLHMERRKAKDKVAAPPLSDFPDPFVGLKSGVARRMKRLYRWLHGREGEYPGIVLSLQDNLVQLLILRLLLEDPPIDPDDRQHSQERGSTSPRNGQTLIVARGKEILTNWGHLFREGSAFSVFNHASLPQTDRKSRNTVGKACRFDVVLTTYDALKGTDVTVSLDDHGWVTKSENLAESASGWMTSRSSQASRVTSKTNKQLSVLHQIEWKRVVFVDATGRKSFLVKQDTSRAAAARAINATSRMAFFQGPIEDNLSSLTTLLKGDKSAVGSLGRVLRIDASQVEEEILFGGSVVDYNDEHFLKSTKPNT